MRTRRKIGGLFGIGPKDYHANRKDCSTFFAGAHKNLESHVDKWNQFVEQNKENTVLSKHYIPVDKIEDGPERRRKYKDASHDASVCVDKNVIETVRFPGTFTGTGTLTLANGKVTGGKRRKSRRRKFLLGKFR